MVRVQLFGTGTRYGYEILQQPGKSVEDKSKNILGASLEAPMFGIREKTDRERFCPPSWIGLIILNFKEYILRWKKHRHIYNSVEHLRWSFSAKIVDS